MKTIYADLDDIVFEDRGKEYGAYQDRKRAQRHLARAALIALILFLCGTAIPKMITWVGTGDKVEKEQEFEIIPVDLTDIELPPPPEEEIKEEVKIPPPPVKTIEFRIPEPTPDDEIEEEETMIEQDSVLENPDSYTSDTTSGEDFDWDKVPDKAPQDGLDIPTEKSFNPDEFVLLDKEPGPLNMDEFKSLIGYPPLAKEADIQGKVVLRVEVDKTGRYVRHVVKMDPHPILTKAVVDKLNTLRFTPGIQNGKPIKVWVTIPVTFSLVK